MTSTTKKQINKLIKAIKWRRLPEFEQLLNDGVDPNQVDKHGRAPLHYVTANAYDYTLRYLPPRGGSVSQQREYNDALKQKPKPDRTMLFMLDTLLRRKDINVMIRDSRGRTPLHYAVEESTNKAIEPLIKAGADVNAQDSRGWSPLHEAVNHKNINACKILIKAGADVALKNNSEYVPAKNWARDDYVNFPSELYHYRKY